MSESCDDTRDENSRDLPVGTLHSQYIDPKKRPTIRLCRESTCTVYLQSCNLRVYLSKGSVSRLPVKMISCAFGLSLCFGSSLQMV